MGLTVLSGLAPPTCIIRLLEILCEMILLMMSSWVLASTILFDFVYEGIWGNYKTMLSSLLSYLSFLFVHFHSLKSILFCVLEKKPFI